MTSARLAPTLLLVRTFVGLSAIAWFAPGCDDQGADAVDAGGNGGASAGIGGTGGAAVLVGAPGGAGGAGPTIGPLDKFLCPNGPWPQLGVDASSAATLVKRGFLGAEGPVWVASLQALFFSQIHRDGADYTSATSTTITKYTPLDGEFSEWVAASGTNGLALGFVQDAPVLFAAAHDNQEISVFDLKSKARSTYVATHLDDDGQLPFNSPNDLTVHSDGTVYFSDPYYQNAGRSGQSAARVYAVSPDRTISVVDAELSMPNGVSLSADQRWLYVTSLEPDKVTRYAIDDEAKPGARQSFASTQGNWPDGMAVDCAGNVFVATNAGVEVFDAEGQAKGIILLDGESATNAAFGGPDRKTLFITAEGATRALYSFALPVPGLPN